MCSIDWNAIAAIITALATIALAIFTIKYVRLTKYILAQTTKSIEAQAMPYFDLYKPGDEKWSKGDGTFIYLYMGNHGGQARNVRCECVTDGYGATVEFPHRTLVLNGERCGIRIHKKFGDFKFGPKDYTTEIHINLFFEDAYGIKYSQFIKEYSGYDIDAPKRLEQKENKKSGLGGMF